VAFVFSKILHIFRMEYPAYYLKEEGTRSFTKLDKQKEIGNHNENAQFTKELELAEVDDNKEDDEILEYYDEIEDYIELDEYEGYFNDPGFIGMIKH
jgi:hypothetical protein